MGSISDYLENKLLDHVLKTAAYSQPAAIYVALSTADPLDTGAGLAEPSGNGYTRVQHDSWDVAASRASENTGVITFPEATGAWGTITHFALFDASSGGNMLGHGQLGTARVVVAMDTPSFADGAIDISVDPSGFSDFLANELLDHVLLTGAYSVPTNLYVAMCTAAIADNDTGSTITEPSGNGYARVNHNAWDAAAAGASENTGAITFPEATGSWGTLTHVGILDASSAGNLLLHSAVGTSKSISSGETAEFADGDIDITLD